MEIGRKLGTGERGRRREQGKEERNETSHIADQFPIIQIALKNNQLRLPQVRKKPRLSRRKTPIATSVRPEAIRADPEPAIGVESRKLAKEKRKGIQLDRRQGFRRPPLPGVAVVVVVRRTGGVESARVSERVQQGGEVGGHDVGHEPGDGFRVQDDAGREPSGQEVRGEEQVDEELEAGVVEDDVDAAVAGGGALRGGGGEDVVGGGQVVGEDGAFGGFAGGGGLECLDVGVGQGGQEGEVGGVAPEADFGHFEEEGLCGLGGVGWGAGGGGGGVAV